MSKFNYTAVDQANHFVKGEIDSYSSKKAYSDLEKRGLLVVSLKKEVKSVFSSLAKFASVSRLDKILLTRHLHTLLESGIGLDQAVKIAAEQSTNQKFKEVLFDIHEKLHKGQAFHVALSSHKKYFSDFFINLVKVGEKSGTLDDTLMHLLEQQEKDYELITKTRGALIYPVIIIIATTLIVTLMMTFVVPTIAGILLEYDVDLPLVTKILIAVSNFLVRYGVLVAVGIILLAIGLNRLVKKTKKGKWYWDSFLLSLPAVKKIIIEFNLARFSRSMSALLKSGVAIDEALELSASVSRNSHYQKTILSSIVFVRKGIPITEVLSGQPKLYPSISTRMLEIGHKTGKLDHMFNRLASFYEKSVLNVLTNLSSIIEPVLLLLIGFVVGFVAVSILTPIWKFAQTI